MDIKLSEDKKEIELTPPQPLPPTIRISVKEFVQQQLDRIAKAQANIKVVTDGGLKVEDVLK